MKKIENLDWKSIDGLSRPMTQTGEFFEAWSLFGISIVWFTSPGYGLYIGQLPGYTPKALIQIDNNGQAEELPYAKNFFDVIVLEFIRCYNEDPAHVGPWREGYIFWYQGLNQGKGVTINCPACKAISGIDNDKGWFKFFVSLLTTSHSANCPYYLYQKMK